MIEKFFLYWFLAIKIRLIFLPIFDKKNFYFIRFWCKKLPKICPKMIRSKETSMKLPGTIRWTSGRFQKCKFWPTKSAWPRKGAFWSAENQLRESSARKPRGCNNGSSEKKNKNNLKSFELIKIQKKNKFL